MPEYGSITAVAARIIHNPVPVILNIKSHLFIFLAYFVYVLIRLIHFLSFYLIVCW